MHKLVLCAREPQQEPKNWLTDIKYQVLWIFPDAEGEDEGEEGGSEKGSAIFMCLHKTDMLISVVSNVYETIRYWI